MLIQPITIINNKYSSSQNFKSNPAILKEAARPGLKQAATLASADAASNLIYDNFLKSCGITYLSCKNNTISMATRKNGGFYVIDSALKMNNSSVQKYVSRLMSASPKALGGLINYIKCLDDLKRQDIIKKGMRVSTYKLNYQVTSEKRNDAQRIFSYHLDRKIPQEEIFYIDEDAMYYDANEKTIYSINMYMKQLASRCKEVFSCKFITDHEGNAIGYKMRHVDNISSLLRETVYMEQQAPSEELPKIVRLDNNKRVAEAFRFGNADADYKYDAAVPIVLKDVSKKLRIENLSGDKLQYTKYYDKQGNIVSRINYYNPVTGRSLVYNNRGQYLYQADFVKDINGNITAVSKY